jgi:hypothetical protein
MLPYEKALFENVPFGSPKYVSSVHSDHQRAMKRHILHMARWKRLPVYLFTNERDLKWYDDMVSDIMFTLKRCSVTLFVLSEWEGEIPSNMKKAISKSENGRIVVVEETTKARPFIIVGISGVCFLSDENKCTKTRYRGYSFFSCPFTSSYSTPLSGAVSMNCSAEGEVIVLLSQIMLKGPIASLLCSLYIPVQ